jgi:acetyl esterase
MTSLQTRVAYDANANYEVTSQDVEYRREGPLTLMARIYQPKGAGPFGGVIAVHGGAWANKEWLQNEASHQKLAAGGAVVAAIQFRTSQDAPHPLAQQDINYAIRWFKAHAAEFNATADQVGGVGWSSGCHTIMLAAMRPDQSADAPLPGTQDVNATLAYVIMGWPVIDPPGRYKLAQDLGNQTQAANHMTYFRDLAGQEEASPPNILERGEAVETPPALLLQGSADEALPRMCAERFVELYSLAGGIIELGKYPGEPHGFMRQDGPNADRAFALAKSFIARHTA